MTFDIEALRWWIVPLFAVAAFAWSIAKRLGRQTEMLKFQQALGLDFLDRDLPSDFPPRALDSVSILARQMNCVSGVYRGERFVCFDYKTKPQHLNFGTAFTIPNGSLDRLPRRARQMVRFQNSRWTILATRPWEAPMHPSKILRMWEEIYSLPGTLTAQQIDADQASGETVIRPHHNHLDT